MKKIKILFVCMGNICRSPLAHEVFADAAKKSGITDRFEIESCGTGAWHIGCLADKRMRAEAARHGITMTHRGRTWQKTDAAYFDIILAMDKTNLQELLQRSNPEYHNKMCLFRTYDPEATDVNNEVPDPYYGEAEDFAFVYTIVKRTVDNLMHELLK